MVLVDSTKIVCLMRVLMRIMVKVQIQFFSINKSLTKKTTIYIQMMGFEVLWRLNLTLDHVVFGVFLLLDAII